MKKVLQPLYGIPVFFIFSVVSLFPTSLRGEEAVLKATRSEFQKIPIWVMGFSPVQRGCGANKTTRGSSLHRSESGPHPLTNIFGR